MFFFSSRRRHTRYIGDWSSDVCSSDLIEGLTARMQRALASVDPSLPFSGFHRMDDLLAKTLATQRVEVALLTTRSEERRVGKGCRRRGCWVATAGQEDSTRGQQGTMPC